MAGIVNWRNRRRVEPMNNYWLGFFSQLNVPNLITLLRAVLGVAAVWLWYEGAEVWLFGLVIFVMISDGEGYLARWLGQTTPLGRALDPLADKICHNSLLAVAAVSSGSETLWLLLSFNLCYDVFNTWKRWEEIKGAFLGQEPLTATLPVTWLSKWKTAYLFVLLHVLFLPTTWYVIPYELTFVAVTLGLVLVIVAWGYNLMRAYQDKQRLA